MESALTFLFFIALFFALFFEIFLLVTYFENRGRFDGVGVSKEPGENMLVPSVTVIVPCWNEERTLGRTVQSLLSLNYPREKFQIFIVDDGSTDRTARIVREFLFDSRVSYFYKENGGKYSALNLGIEKASTDLIGCLDADSFVSPDSLSRIVRAFEDSSVMAVTPAIRVWRPETWIQKIQETEYTIGILFKRLLAFLNAQYVTPGPFSVYRREVFETAGIFRHAHQTEDMEMALRMHSRRLKIENVFDAEVFTVAPKTFRGIIQQRLRWTYGFVRNTAEYRHMLFRPHYGNLGLFSLPLAMISLVAVLYSAFYLLWKIGAFITDMFVRLSTVGVSSHISDFRLEWFFINTTAVVFVTTASLVFFLSLFFLSVYRVRGGLTFKLGDIYFILLYGLIAPIWIARAAIKLVSRAPLRWR